MDEAFTSLKISLSDNPILLAPNMLKPFTLCTDASGVGLGAVLSQVVTVVWIDLWPIFQED